MGSNEMRHYFTSGFFADAKRSLVPGTRPELVGTEKLVAADIEHRLSRGRGSVLFVELGGQAGASSAVLSEWFTRDIRRGRLTVMVTNHERRSGVQILRASERVMKQSKRSAEIIPDMDTAMFIREHMHLIDWRSGVDTIRLPQLTSAYGGADVIHECMAGLFFHPDRPRAFQAVTAALKPGGALFTRETPDKDRSYGAFPSDVMKPDGWYVWGVRGYRIYRKNG